MRALFAQQHSNEQKEKPKPNNTPLKSHAAMQLKAIRTDIPQASAHSRISTLKSVNIYVYRTGHAPAEDEELPLREMGEGV